jgi:hypothetical protein
MPDLPDLSAMTLGELRDEYIVLREVIDSLTSENSVFEDRNRLRNVREAINIEMIRRVREKYRVKV